MKNELLFSDISDFIKELKHNDIEKVAFSQVNEKRTKQVSPEELHVVHVKKVDILAYKDSIVYKCILEDVDLESTHILLQNEGFEVTRINKNIT